MASIYLPPIARKKKVDGWPRQNTSRVFPDMEENARQEGTSYKSQFVRHNVPPTPQRIASASRKNKPQSKTVTFLRQNPRFVCEPICHVDDTTSVQEERNGNIHSWWPDETIQSPVVKPMYSLSSTSRADYKNFSFCSSQTGYSRHENLSFNVPRTKGAVGIVPGYRSSENAHPILEKISYEHQYNSRLDPGHPVRGKRHGCFVWKVTTPTRNKHGRDRSLSSRNDIKDVSYELTNAETIDDNMDAKSMVSTISDKTTKVVNVNPRRSKEEPQLKNDAWSTPALRPNTNPIGVARQHEQSTQNNDFEMTDHEVKDAIKPSRPRRLSPPPHTI